jgi:putative transposase
MVLHGVTKHRRRLFVNETARACLRGAIAECRIRYPFHIDAWVVLPDHIHCVWTLPEDDRDYSRRWSIIKRGFTQLYRRHAPNCGGHGPPYWQERFWAHRIDDEADYRHHLDYVHINPVKHGLTDRVSAWPWSTFHRYVDAGVYPADWGGKVVLPKDVGNE